MESGTRHASARRGVSAATRAACAAMPSTSSTWPWACSTSTKRLMCVPLYWCGRSTASETTATACCSCLIAVADAQSGSAGCAHPRDQSPPGGGRVRFGCPSRAQAWRIDKNSHCRMERQWERKPYAEESGASANYMRFDRASALDFAGDLCDGSRRKHPSHGAAGSCPFQSELGEQFRVLVGQLCRSGMSIRRRGMRTVAHGGRRSGAPWSWAG